MEFMKQYQNNGINGTVPTEWNKWNSTNRMEFMTQYQQNGIYETVPTEWNL